MILLKIFSMSFCPIHLCMPMVSRRHMGNQYVLKF